jgi:hypothetical protein
MTWSQSAHADGSTPWLCRSLVGVLQGPSRKLRYNCELLLRSTL